MFSTLLKNKRSPIMITLSIVALCWAIMGVAENAVTAEQNGLPYVELKRGENLAGDAGEANSKQIPILMFFSMNHCPYCVEVEEDYLKPILRNAEYNNKVIIRKVRLDGSNMMYDFKNKYREPGEFSDQYNVSMVPTLVLVDANGKQLAKSIIGIANSHYYSAELDQAINQATLKIRGVAKR